MPWYVFALVDRAPAARQGRGFAGALSARAVPGGFAMLERRADVPPAEFGTLSRHDAVVTRLADAVPAILPVRFGTLVEMDEIESALEEREEEMAEAFDLVRNRVQFTWRSARGLGAEARSAKPAAQGAGGASGALSGREYLKRAAAKAAPPPFFRGVREKLKRLVTAERFQPATPTVPESLYHLVDRSGVERYRLLAEELAQSSPAVRVSGPFPPFAFTPDLL